MMRTLLLVSGVLSGVLCLPGTAWAQRDPTLPPGWSQGDAPARPARQASGRAVVVVNGQARLVVGTRLLAEGDQLGSARIERITETELWLREGSTLRKLPHFPAAQRQAASGPAPAASSTRDVPQRDRPGE